ncbi:MAG: glycosyltransferase family 2 protein [Chloroflexi bacterium]|nr:glycosyltransferase family 2 protein [Chloroflexota bacterium]
MASDVAVSIVHYRTPEPLLACLQALELARAECSLDVTVTDNASGDDGTASRVTARFPLVRWVQNDRNLGYGRAHNQALRHTHARHLLVLNADATLQAGALGRLVAELDAQPAVAVVGPRLRYPDGRPQPSRRRFPRAATFFVESTQLQRFLPSNPVLERYYVADCPDDEPQDVDWLVGACLLVRARAAIEIGLFDERYFLYSEEIDWCRRFRAAGWGIRYLPTAAVVHVEGASTRQAPAERAAHFWRSRLRYVETWHGRRLARALRAYLLLEAAARTVEESVELVRGSRVEQRQAHLAEIRALVGGLRG